VSLAVAAIVASVVTTAGRPGPWRINPYGLMTPGTLVVGMDLQFKPQMYLQNGKPAGYDVVLLRALARQLGVKLKIENLDFNGLIPGLQSKKFDMVSVGLSPTPERQKVISFSRAYVPYAQLLAAKKGDTTAASVSAWNDSSKTITSLQGSTAEQLVQKLFPKAKDDSFPDQNAAFLQVATGRASGIVVENYSARAVQQVEREQARRGRVPRPLQVQYGAYAVQKGTDAREDAEQVHLQRPGNGQLARIYEQTEARRCRQCRAASARCRRSGGPDERPVPGRKRPGTRRTRAPPPGRPRR
jgi:ABC-type amino acid transport substrate-binding protein